MGEDAETQGRPLGVTRCAPGKLPGRLVRFAGRGFGRRGAPGRDGVGDARVCLLCAPCTPCASVPHPAGLVPVLFACGRVQALR